MTVYLVIGVYNYEGGTVRAVYDNEGAAEAHKADLIASNRYDDVHVHEYPLDSVFKGSL